MEDYRIERQAQKVLEKAKKQNEFARANIWHLNWAFIGKAKTTVWNSEATPLMDTWFYIADFGTTDNQILAIQVKETKDKTEYRWQISDMLHLSGEMQFESNLKG